MAGAPLASKSATFDATGVATLTIGPTVYGSSWHVDRMVVSTTGTRVPRCDVYLNYVSDGTKVDNTRTGNADTSDTNIDLTAPNALVFLWTSGNSGDVATAVVSGTLTTGR